MTTSQHSIYPDFESDAQDIMKKCLGAFPFIWVGSNES